MLLRQKFEDSILIIKIFDLFDYLILRTVSISIKQTITAHLYKRIEVSTVDDVVDVVFFEREQIRFSHDSDRRSNVDLFNVKSTQLIVDAIQYKFVSSLCTRLFIPNGHTSVISFNSNSVVFHGLVSVSVNNISNVTHTVSGKVACSR